MADPGITQPNIFISYSHKDEEWKDTLSTQIAVLQSAEALLAWDDRRIGAGENWRSEIEQAMDAAKPESWEAVR